jgi:hypothetical protein
LLRLLASLLALLTILESRWAEARPSPADLDEASARASLSSLSFRPAIDSDRTGDLTPKAKAILDRKDALAGQVVTLRDVWPVVFAGEDVPPATIRVWRRRLDGSATSCAGRVDAIPFEEYVKGVLPHEWITSWDPKSLEMGAVAIRTYAWWWVQAGGKYDCADLDDTTASQVYEDERLEKTNAAVDATSGVGIFKDGSLVFAEYSAENGDPTDFGVVDPHCAGEAVFGHGRGTCQWGTQRWATTEGRDFMWMSAHYYPGAEARVPGLPQFAALFASESYPTSMTSGEEAVVWIELENDGSATWSSEDTRIGTTGPTDRASPFFKEGNWLAPNRPSAADHSDYARGAVGRFSFVLKAPEVDVPTTFVETFGLVQEGVTWFGGEETLVTWNIEVNPKPENDSGNFLTNGCAITVPKGTTRGALSSRTSMYLALAAMAWRRGRRFRVVASEVMAFLFALGVLGLGACAPDAAHTSATQRSLLGGDSQLVPIFTEASKESGVPAEILATVGFVQTRLRMGLDRDPEMREHGMPPEYGMMAIRDADEGAWLIGLDPEFVKSDARSNIRAAAAILAVRAADLGVEPRALGDWAPVLDGIGDEVMWRLERGWRGLDEDGKWVVVTSQKVGGLHEGIGAQTFSLGYSGAIWNPAYSGNYAAGSRGAAQINYIVIHTVQGSYAGCISWFKNPDANVSAHYVVRSSDGEVTQMVDDSDVAWHDACFNSETIGIEHEGFVADPDAWYTEAMYAGSARLTAWLADQYGVPKDRDHIFGHGEAPDCSDHTDPGGGWDWAHYMELVISGGVQEFEARGGSFGYPDVMTSGEEGVAWFEFVNDGNTTWGLDETRLGTQEPQDRESAFFVPGNWLSPSRPTGADHSNYTPGATGRFSFVIKAPEVDTETTYTETFQLVQEGVSWFGPLVTMTITVRPRDTGVGGEGEGGEGEGGDEGQDPGNPDPGDGSGSMSGGCAVGGASSGGAPFALVCLCAILGLGVLPGRRRR